MRKNIGKGTAYVLCAAILFTSAQPMAAAAMPERNNHIFGDTYNKASKASVSGAEKAEKKVKSEKNRERTAASGQTGYAENNQNSMASPATASQIPKEVPPEHEARAASSLGDIWDNWAGKTSFEFLNGRNGEGTREKPFLIKNREQLMGLSELAAMGMTVLDSAGIDYAGDYTGCYFSLGANIDLQGIDWIPIGFYRDSSEKNGDVPYAFSGHFNGNGHTIRNLKLNTFSGYNHVGLFGAIENSEISQVTILPDGGSEIKGNDRTGIVAGYAKDSLIRDVTVKNGYVSSTGVSGGVAGETAGSVIENVICEKVMVNAADGAEVIYAGGIAGIASDSSIVDCKVSTGDGNTARIQGKGYIGGIVGFQNGTDIYNTQVSGTIGGYHSTAIGGVTGRYASGKLKVARFEGTIGNSQLGSLAREGTFIGTRQGAATNFNYIEDVAYLFADSESKISANVCGSEVSDDNDYTYEAHVGYWHKGDLFYTLLQGGAKKEIVNQYFYEELEEGILTVLDEEGRSRYSLDHFAPDALGRPVRGYLLNVNQIDTVAGGQNFYDIAALEVRGSSQYSKVIDKEHRGAIAAGSVVNISTAPKNTDREKFQMEGTPFYTNGDGVKKSTAYSQESHCYTFPMPAEDVAVSAIYKKVAVSVKVEPETYSFIVTQTRSGNRKSPAKLTEIKNKEGKLIARYINGQLEQGTQVQPVKVNATIDANNDVVDGRIKWSIDDPDLIQLAVNDDEGSDGYTEKSASLSVNLKGGFFKDIIEEAERKQAQENYQYKIPNTIYGVGHQNGGVAVLTAQTRPAASFEGKPCTANSRINVTFQIIDNTLVATEGAVIDKPALSYTVVRRLTGNRLAPEETKTVTPPQSLTATFTPDFFSKDQVTWTSSDPAVAQVFQDEGAYREALITALKDAKWIQDIEAADNGIRQNDKYARISGKGSREITVTVDGKDRLGNHASAACQVRVNFVTDDQTRIVPEEILLNEDTITYTLGYQKKGDIQSDTISKSGFTNKKLSALVLPDITDNEFHHPYERAVIWTSSDPEAVKVGADGTVTPVDQAPWIQEALSKAPYSGRKSVEITAVTQDGKKAKSCQVELTFQAESIEADREKEVFDIVMTKTGRRGNPSITWSGLEGKKLNAAIYTISEKKGIQWNSEDQEVLSADKQGMIRPVVLNEKGKLTAGWIQEVMKAYPSEGEKTVVVSASSEDGKMTDQVEVKVRFHVVDNTISGEGSSGGSSSGGGGGGSIGVTTAGNTKGQAAPAGAVTGTWTQMANGNWLFATNRTYTDEWAYISNPYATGEQEKASWFRFDKDGFMVTGWFMDTDNNVYYLKKASDGTQGQLMTGWQLIDGMWYFFNLISDGTRGRMLSNTSINGYQLNEKGQWIAKK